MGEGVRAMQQAKELLKALPEVSGIWNHFANIYTKMLLPVIMNENMETGGYHYMDKRKTLNIINLLSTHTCVQS